MRASEARIVEFCAIVGVPATRVAEFEGLGDAGGFVLAGVSVWASCWGVWVGETSWKSVGANLNIPWGGAHHPNCPPSTSALATKATGRCAGSLTSPCKAHEVLAVAKAPARAHSEIKTSPKASNWAIRRTLAGLNIPIKENKK